MIRYRRWTVQWMWPYEDWFGTGARFNGGGYLYGASPYQYWRIGPIFVKRYM